ncbi:hypothetical protein AN214_03449 [Pseudoalteromonas sp. P1-9]|uniref:DUF2835 domain-containing protein n=1 Tax=Pseudoalteromonas sp. P1-9 TaxID=1710354 RepID=UPI0006D62565|nr:DUF2835 domain-containing protein [Pseudoalteromonas sp. P1-9]KPV94523.1 hypothetical protein AN214_03449 [Pseudoalteromonas sp. P1-9]
MERNTYYFSINLNYQECMAYYKGHYTSIQVLSDCGKTIRFAAEKLRPFMSSIGIKGRFRIHLTTENKFISIEKVN